MDVIEQARAAIGAPRGHVRGKARTTDRDELIERLWAYGYSGPQLAAYFQMKLPAVYQALQRRKKARRTAGA